VLLADWALGHERIAQQALALATELALLEPGWTERTMEAIARLGPEDLFRAARELFGPVVSPDVGSRRSAVIGWSLPSGAEEAGP
jgi:hypothetical protein